MTIHHHLPERLFILCPESRLLLSFANDDDTHTSSDAKKRERFGERGPRERKECRITQHHAASCILFVAHLAAADAVADSVAVSVAVWCCLMLFDAVV